MKHHPGDLEDRHYPPVYGKDGHGVDDEVSKLLPVCRSDCVPSTRGFVLLELLLRRRSIRDTDDSIFALLIPKISTSPKLCINYVLQLV
jgi:hypothetical protein